MTNNDTPIKEYKYLLFVAMLYITIMLTCAVLTYRPVKMWFGYASAATLFFPTWFILSDIIAEVYGFKLSRRILWYAIICQFIFTGVCCLMLKTTPPLAWSDHGAYDLVLGHLIRITITASFTILISGYLNMYLVTKWKVLLKGRYFWIRSVGASIIGEGLYSAIAVFLMQYKMAPLSGIPLIIFWAYSAKIIGTIILATPASLACSYLKLKEGVDIYERNVNPLKNLKI